MSQDCVFSRTIVVPSSAENVELWTILLMCWKYHHTMVWVWSGISIGGHTDLYVVLNGALTTQRYRDEILRPFVVPYAGAIGDWFLLVDDNSRFYWAILLDNMLEAKGNERMEWPACSANLNSIEHFLDALDKRIATRPAPPTTVEVMNIVLMEEWPNIPPELIDNLLLSMPRRCATLLAIRGSQSTLKGN